MPILEPLSVLEDEDVLVDLDDVDIDHGVLDELGAAAGLTCEDEEELYLVMKEVERDRHRWELDPASADDWGERWRW